MPDLQSFLISQPLSVLLFCFPQRFLRPSKMSKISSCPCLGSYCFRLICQSFFMLLLKSHGRIMPGHCSFQMHKYANESLLRNHRVFGHHDRYYENVVLKNKLFFLINDFKLSHIQQHLTNA